VSHDVNKTAFQLRTSLSAFRRRAHEVSTAGDLAAPQITALSRLDRFGPMTTAELARREQITPQAMGATVASLEQLGLVDRRPDAADGRRRVIQLTVAGQAALGSGRSAITDRIAAVLAEHFTDEEIVTLDAAAPLISRLSDLL